jgi:multicomponent Na+:H+ antiporter subunit E
MLAMFLLNVLLAIIWAMLTGAVHIGTLLVGFLIGYAILGVVGPALGFGSSDYGRKAYRWVGFGFYFLRILIEANVQVAWELITPGYQMTPRILRIPVDDMTELQTTFFANTITLTPGTLSIDLSRDRRWLYVHSMYAADRASAERDLLRLKERVLEGLFR